MASTIDSLIAIAIVSVFIFFVGAKVYDHEKAHIDPLIAKIKGWFNKDTEDEGEEAIGPNDDFEIDFKGQMQE